MARNLLDLAKSLEARAKKVGDVATEAKVSTALLLVKELTNRTPVDTSQALSNWQVSLGAPNYSFIPAHSPGYLGYTAASSQQTALALARSILSKIKPGQVIYVTNNADYIRKLNSGSSRQAPAGFVEASVLVARLRGANSKVA